MNHTNENVFVWLSCTEGFAAELDLALERLPQTLAHCVAVAVERTGEVDVVGGVVCAENAALGVDMLEQDESFVRDFSGPPASHA